MRVSSNLDLLRALAVIYVTLDHSLAFFGVSTNQLGFGRSWLGLLGVMFFFVHTCAVLMMSLGRSDRKLASLKNLSFNFYLRRIFRIYPLSILALTTVLLFSIPSALISGPFLITGFTPTRADIILNYLLLQNFHHKSIIAPLWSLPFEMQMYLLLPLIFILAVKKNRLAWLFALWFLGFVGMYALKPHLIFLAHFIPGVIAYVLIDRVKKPLLSAWVWPLFLAALTVVFLRCSPSFVTGSIACLLLGLMLPHFRDIRSNSVNFLTHNIAKYSYGIYLAHMFCLWFAFDHLQTRSEFLRISVFGGLLVGIPITLFHAIEDPMILLGSKLAGRFFSGARNLSAKSTAGIRARELEETASGN